MTFGGHKYIRPIYKAGVDKVIDDYVNLAESMEPKIAEAFRSAMEELRNLIPEAELTRLIESGEIQQIMAQFNDASIQNITQELSASISEAVLAGAQLTASLQPRVIGQNGINVIFQFNPTNPLISDYAIENATLRIREISEDIRHVIREVVRRETIAGVNPRTVARAIRQSIGLTAKQEAAVMNFRRMLEELDPTVLERALRDKRFDRAILRAIRNQTSMSKTQINQMVARYRQRFIKFRSEVIARTEAIGSVQGGHHRLYQSYINSGQISESQIKRFWHFTRDSRTRDEHKLIPGMNLKGVEQNEPFKTPLGPLMFPGDPSGTADNIIQCRCAVFTRVVAPELVEA